MAANIDLADILAAADDYFEASGRRLTFEYVLLAGVNDQRRARPRTGRAAVRTAGAGELDSVQSGGRTALSHAESDGNGTFPRHAGAKRA